MPELPEVEIVRQGLLTKIVGETIAKVEILREQSVAYPTPEKFSKALRGLTFTDIDRRGKYLLLHLSKQSMLVIHLRMSGRLLLFSDKNSAKNKSAQKLKFLRVRILLSNGKELCFDDMRVFGRLWYVSNADKLFTVIPSLAKLGVEPLYDLTTSRLQKLFAKRRQGIKSALLDQTLIAGIGNIYADEILFQAGIHPLTAAEKIGNKKAKDLARIIPLTLKRAIELGGSSIKDFVDSDGVNGNYQHESLVYGRTNKPCRICQSKIERIKIAGRSAHFCPVCQNAKSY